MSIQNTEEISLRELEDRQLLYSFYYELMSEIKGKK